MLLFSLHIFLCVSIYRQFRIYQATWWGLEFFLFFAYFYMLWVVNLHIIGIFRAQFSINSKFSSAIIVIHLLTWSIFLLLLLFLGLVQSSDYYEWYWNAMLYYWGQLIQWGSCHTAQCSAYRWYRRNGKDSRWAWCYVIYILLLLISWQLLSQCLYWDSLYNFISRLGVFMAYNYIWVYLLVAVATCFILVCLLPTVTHMRSGVLRRYKYTFAEQYMQAGSWRRRHSGTGFELCGVWGCLYYYTSQPLYGNAWVIKWRKLGNLIKWYDYPRSAGTLSSGFKFGNIVFMLTYRLWRYTYKFKYTFRISLFYQDYTNLLCGGGRRNFRILESWGPYILGSGLSKVLRPSKIIIRGQWQRSYRVLRYLFILRRSRWYGYISGASHGGMRFKKYPRRVRRYRG